MREFWLNKPFSDPIWATWFLWRFGQLITGMDLRPGDRVLDFGCGTGWTSILLARMGMEVVGMDIAPAALEIAQEVARRTLTDSEMPRLQFQTYSGDTVPWPNEHFDFVLIFEALHHLPNPRTVIGEFYRVLAPHGRFGFAEPGVAHSAAEISKTEMEEGILEQDLDLEQLYRTGLTAGFAGMEVVVPAPHPHGMTLPMGKARWFLRGLSWLVPANLIRASILSSPMGMFWKGPYFLSSLHPRSNEARIRPQASSVASGPGQLFEIGAQVKNPSATTWLKEGLRGRGYVRLGAHLIDSDGRMLQLDYGRAELPHDLHESETARITLRLRAPEQKGRYIVQLDMVNEGICWFAQEESKVASVELVVE